MAAPADERATETLHVVFVHGLFSSESTWDQFRKLLAADDELRGVVAHSFSYSSKKARFRPDRALAQYDDIADSLGVFLSVQIPRTGRVVLVTHSQGGLIVQRYLVRTLHEARGHTLARIAEIVMFGCPNNGSGFLLPLRRMLFFLRNPQERQLRPYRREVLETQRAVLRSVVQAERDDGSQRRIPIQAYGGTEDNVVPAREARGVFPDGATVPGDHFQIIQPEHHDAAPYRVVADVLSRLLAEGGESSGDAGDGEAPAGRPASPELPGGPEGGVSRPRPEKQQSDVSLDPPYGRRRKRLYGREPRSIIARILETPAPGDHRIHVLAGLGGSGKSRIALEAAYRAEHGRRVWWVTVPRINVCMREVANQLGTPSGEIEQAFRGDGSPMDLVWRYLEASPEPWMLVIDNADTPHRLAPETGQVADGTGWVRQPMQADGIVVVTTRDRAAASWLPPCRVHHVPLLDQDDGADLLLEAVPDGGTREEARNLSAALGGLPLALHGAASYLSSVHDPALSLDDPAIHDFTGYRTAFEARSASPPGTTASGLDEMLGLSAMTEVCGIALDLLSSQGMPQAGPLLRMFACLGIAPIPYRPLLESRAITESLLLPDFTRVRRNAVLKGLDDLGLVERISRPEAEGGRPALTLHPVVHALLRGDTEVQQHRAEYYGLIVDLLLEVIRQSPPDDPVSWDIWSGMAPHTMEVVRACLTGGSRMDSSPVLRGALELARLTIRYLISVGLLRPAQELATTVLDNCVAAGFPRDSREILGVRHEQGRIALESGDYARAESELHQVAAVREGLLGAKDPQTLASRHKHARSIFEQGRFREAEPLLRSIVQAELVVHGPDHSDTVTVRHSLARAVFALGRTVEAEKELRDILQISLGKWFPSTMETLRIRQTLARCLMVTKRTDEAGELIRQALSDTTHATDSALAMTLRFTQCQVLIGQGRFTAAHTQTEQLLVDRKRVLGREHPETLRTQRLLDAIEDLLHFPSGKPGE
ncbi:alpha/beta fold hydrolase [Streptomyces sp. NPDC046924]|uniref:alpha/beta hydrolase n=1 Tax=Streptomyces sp. NPDC046924 TaxID=3155136 RepID=UPI0033C7B06A